jgi:hypothetical protein
VERKDMKRVEWRYSGEKQEGSREMETEDVCVRGESECRKQDIRTLRRARTGEYM